MIDKRAGASGQSADRNAYEFDVFPVGGDQNTSNRPANNAHRATPAAARAQAQAWQTQGGAEDFLGLDQELARGSQPAQFAAPAAMFAAPMRPVAAPQPPPAQRMADESWLMDMTEDHSAEQVTSPSAARDSLAAAMRSADAEADPLLNASWSESDKPPRKRSFVMPLAVCAVLGALVMVGVPMLNKPRAPQGPVSKPVAQTSSTTQAPTSIAAAKPEPRPIGDREPAPSIATLRDPAPAPHVDVPSVTLPPDNSREVVDGRAAVASSNEQTNWVDDLVEVVPAPVPNPRPGNTGDPSTSSMDNASIDVTDIDDQDPDTIDPAPQGPPPSQLNSGVLPATPSSQPTEKPVDSIVAGSNVAVTPTASATNREVATPQQPATKVEVAPATSTTVASTTPVAAPPQSDAAAPVAPAGSGAASEIAPTEVVTPLPPPFAPRWIGPKVDALTTPVSLGAASVVGPRAPSDSDSAKDGSSGHEARKTSVPVADVLLLRDGQAPLRQASAKDMSGVWTQTTVPLESIGSPTKLLTPAVGKVRVVLASGEIFEGGLYAVGESCVWLDTQYGRMGLAGTRVKSVVQIDAPKGTPALGAPGSQALAGLERVRIKTPGGVFYGKIIDKDAKTTTLVTDDGARLTLDSKDVELLTQSPIVTLKKH